MQFAGFTVGRSQSFFDLFTYGGAYSYHNVRVSGDTGASGQNLWAYTAQFGNGFSGTLSLEDPATRKVNGTVDVTNAAFFGQNGAVVNDNGLTINPTFGFRVPDVVANLRVDQAWGFAGISAALHDASARLLCDAERGQQRPSRRSVRLGVGWRCQVQPFGRRHDRLQRLLLRRRSRHVHQPSVFQLYRTATAWLRLDCRWCFQHRHPDRADQGVECSCRVRAHLEPEMADCRRWRLRQRRLQRDRDQHHQRAAPRCRPGELRCGGGRCAPSPPSLRASATAAIRTTASGKPIPAPSGTRCRSSISVCR